MSTSFIQTDDRNDRAVAYWLLTVAFLVFAMIVVGGATRLTGSGLSMVDWHPVRGVIPPLNAAEWQEEFANYQQYPEFQKVNQGMTVEEFKGIFWWEFGHRLLGRTIGLAFALPLLFFLARRMVRPELKMRLFGLLALGGAQGLMGWYMVMSGLVDNPAVSHYRLAAHLLLALLIISALMWVALSLLRPHAGQAAGQANVAVQRLSVAMLVLLTLQIFWGALVAGLDAGFSFNTWPLMDAGFLPPGGMDLSPWWLNFLENHATVQFTHRCGAYLVLLLAAWTVAVVYERGKGAGYRSAALTLAAAVVAQVFVGIWTLVSVVPVSLGTLHQGIGVIVLAAALWFAFEARIRPATIQTPSP